MKSSQPLTMLLAAGLAAATLMSPVNAQESKEYSIKAASEVKVEGDIEVEIEFGKKPSLIAMSEDGDFTILEVEQHGDRISLRAVEDWMDKRRRKGNSRDHDGYQVKLTIPELSELHAQLGGRAAVDNVRANDLDIHTNTGGSIDISGTCDDLNIRVNTGGHIEAEDLKCNEIDVKANTGGYAKVHFAKDHDTSANTGGQVVIVNADYTSTKTNITGGEVVFRK